MQHVVVRTAASTNEFQAPQNKTLMVTPILASSSYFDTLFINRSLRYMLLSTSKTLPPNMHPIVKRTTRKPTILEAIDKLIFATDDSSIKKMHIQKSNCSHNLILKTNKNRFQHSQLYPFDDFCNRTQSGIRLHNATHSPSSTCCPRHVQHSVNQTSPDISSHFLHHPIHFLKYIDVAHSRASRV